MSTSGKNLSLKAYIDGKEASIEIPYESLFELFEFRKQYEEYAKDVSTPVDYHEPERIIYDSAKLLVKHGVCSTELLQRHFRMGYGEAASIIDELENLGVITPVIGNKRFIKVKNEEELCDIFKKQIALNVIQLKDMRSAIEVILKRKRCTTTLVQKSLDWGYGHTQTTILNLEIIGVVSPRIEGKIERDILIKNLAEYDKMIEQLQLSK